MKNYFGSFLIVAVIFLNFVCCANQNVIDSITISKSKINVSSTGNVSYKVQNTDNDTVLIDFKNSILASNSSVNYGAGANVQSAILKQADNNSVKIQIKGRNAKNLQIAFVKNQKIKNENDTNQSNPIIPYIVMFMVMIITILVVLKSLSSKIEADYNNIEIIRSIDNVKSVKITANEYKKAKENLAKTMQNVSKKEYVTQIRRNKNKKTDKNIESPIKV